MIAGIDFSTRAIDVVLLDEDSDAATWHRFELVAIGKRDDAFERTRAVRAAMPGSSFWDDVMAIGIEQPRGKWSLVDVARVQGAVLACIPAHKQVEPHNPSEWRKTVGLPGNCAKEVIMSYVDRRLGVDSQMWPQDACDAYCIALATRTLLQHGEKAA